MKFVFWQNALSIHQSALISTLAESHEVILVVEQLCLSSRKKSGWGLPEMGEAVIISEPSDIQILSLVDFSKDVIHIFSGISAFPMVYKAFKAAASKRLHVIVYLEPYKYNGWIGVFRRIKYFFLNLRYGRYIHAFLVTGKTGVRAYSKAGFSSQKVFEWGYFTDHTPHKKTYPNEGYRIMYVGDLIPRKRIIEFTTVLINMVTKVKACFMARCYGNEKRRSCPADVSVHSIKLKEFAIIGDGPQQKKLMDLINGHEFINYLGTIQNSEVRSLINKYDLLVLPSSYDGWGAVVNEALQSGTRVLCSDACGASTLLDGVERGGTFSWQESEGLEKALNYWLTKGCLTQDQRRGVAEWAAQYISGKAAAKYFFEIIEHTVLHSTSKPIPPWLKC